MAKFTDYTQKTKPADADLLLIHDNAGAANKKTPFSGVWSWILDKLASAVISQLETTNKSIIPAINELNSKTLNNGIKNQSYSKTYKLSSGCSYLLTYVRIREGNIAESSLNVGLISTGEKTSAKSLIQWIVKNGQNQSMFEFDETDSSILRVNVPASTWIVMSITKL